MSDLLRNALIMDSETLGLGRGSFIHELALYDFESRTVKEWILTPRAVTTTGGDPRQDALKLTSRAGEKHVAHSFKTWKEAIQFQIAAEGGMYYENITLDQIKSTNEFLASALEADKFPHLSDREPTRAEKVSRASAFSAQGIRLQTNKRHVTPTEMISTLSQEIKGKTVWIANAAFESKQIGAQIGADIHLDTKYREAEAQVQQLTQQRQQLTQRLGKGNDDEIRRQIAQLDKNPAFERFEALKGKANASGDFKHRAALETFGPSPDALYVTGKEVNAARVTAQATGDWTKVYKAYKQFTPKAGETAVRDILDVTKAVMSYGRKLGLMEGGSHYFGTGIDITARLLGSLEKDPKKALALLNMAEYHRAAEDAAVSERYVLENMVGLADALEAVHEKGAGYEKIIRQAELGEGPLAMAARYFKRLEYLGTELNTDGVRKRLARAQLDMMTENATWQVSGIERISSMKQQNPLGESVRIPRSVLQKTKFTDMDEFVEWLKTDSRYTDFGVDIDAEYAEMRKVIANKGHAEAAQALETYKKFGQERVTTRIKTDAKQIMEIGSGGSLRNIIRSRQGHSFLTGAVDSTFGMASQAGKKFAAASMGIAALGAVWSLGGGRSSENRQASIVALDYQDYARMHSQNGLTHQGMASESRRTRTDFGSPYQGMQGSAVVAVDQKLLQEREKYLRQQYGVRHFDPEYGLFGIAGPFRQSMKYFGDGTRVRDGYQGLRGANLVRLNLSDGNWKVSADDADTITLKRGGVRGAVASFFGFNKGYSFRMAGTDSTETDHGPTSYHAPQPYAEAATEAFKAMIRGSKNLELVYDPTNTTYGRMMGALVGDGRNLNFETVRRGMAAHLPYGNPSDSMIDYSGLKIAENQAIATNRGMWSTPWAQTYAAITTESGSRVTFNTLSSAKNIAKNNGTMQMVSLMETAQAHGFASNQMASAATLIGRQYRVGADKVAPAYMEAKTVPWRSINQQVLNDTRRMQTTKGTNRNANKLAHSQNKARLNKALTLDSMGTTNSVYNQKMPEDFGKYQRSVNIRRKLAAGQRAANQEFGRSPINHHLM